MCRIPYTRRRDGRYLFRRRVHFRNLISTPVTLALRTADPNVARHRASILSTRFAQVRLNVSAMMNAGRPLTGTEIEALFRSDLEHELTRNINDAYENAPWSASVADAAVALAEGYKIARRPDRPLNYPTPIEPTLRRGGSVVRSAKLRNISRTIATRYRTRWSVNG